MTNVCGIVVLEGANATGKTTVANELQRRHDAVIFHQTYRFKHNIFAYHQAVLKRALQLAKNRLVVLDRLWMSEAVYAEIYRGGTPWPHQGRVVDRVLQRACAIQVMCVDGSDEELLSRYRKTRANRTDVDAQNNLVANKLYRTVLYGTERERKTYLDDLAALATVVPAAWRDDIIEHNTYEGSIEQTCYTIERKLQELQSTQLDDAVSNDNFLGRIHSRTRFLFCGDVPNAKHRWTWPFFEYRDSSLWLAKQFHALNFDESTAIWTNVNDSSRNTIQQLVVQQAPLMSRIQVVALGKAAEKTLMSYGICSVTVPHPQHGRRFASNGKSFQDAIRNVLALSRP
jgi:chloramphenicol 3-O-phosphotransferase